MAQNTRAEMAAERRRQASSVLRCIRENQCISAAAIAGRLGIAGGARAVRNRIRDLRGRDHAIVIGKDGGGYIYLPDVADATLKSDLVKAHRSRSRDFLIAHAVIMKQLGQMSAAAIGEQMLFDLTVQIEAAEKAAGMEIGPKDLARLPVERRRGLFGVVMRLLGRLAKDPVAFAAERAALADKFGQIFLTKTQAVKLAQAKALLEEVTA